MKKILTLSAIASLSLLLVTSVFHIRNGFDLFMSATPIHDVARIVLIGGLVVTLFIERPRSKVMRMAFALISAGVTIYAVGSAANYTLQLFDTLAYALSAVILMTESLEINEEEQQKVIGSANRVTLS